MFTHKGSNKTVISFTDNELSYITLNKNEHVFSVEKHETITLPKGTVVRGEILKADLLSKILTEMSSKLPNKAVDVLLPHDYFLCAEGVLKPEAKNYSLKKRVKRYFEDIGKTETWHKTHICEFSNYTIDNKEQILFKCLPKDMQESYVHVFKKSGLQVTSLVSDILAFDHVLTENRTSLVSVGHNNIRVTEFKEGMYKAYKTFQVSYNQFVEDIKTNLNISDTDAKKILNQYGVLRAHRDEKVYKKLHRSLSPLLEFMMKRKIKTTSSVKIVFADTPVLGLVDMFKKSLNVEVSELDILKTDYFTFQDVLALHRKESYQYQALIAQALKHWKI
jgi:Tfp pilus assembly PilM family ATPase